MTEVKFYDPLFEPIHGLTYSVIAARYGNEWIYVRHRDRDTWEIPGGHIEENETPGQAASRELIEETGALEFSIECIATYSVHQDGHTGYGRLYLADVIRIGAVPDLSEIAEVRIMEGLPGNLTYPYIQTRLFEKINSWLEK